MRKMLGAVIAADPDAALKRHLAECRRRVDDRKFWEYHNKLQQERERRESDLRARALSRAASRRVRLAIYLEPTGHLARGIVYNTGTTWFVRRDVTLRERLAEGAQHWEMPPAVEVVAATNQERS